MSLPRTHQAARNASARVGIEIALNSQVNDSMSDARIATHGSPHGDRRTLAAPLAPGPATGSAGSA